jgi:hypothetical protein
MERRNKEVMMLKISVQEAKAAVELTKREEYRLLLTSDKLSAL